MTDFHRYQQYRLQRSRGRRGRFVRYLILAGVLVLVIILVRNFGRGNGGNDDLTIQGGVEENANAPAAAEGGTSNTNGASNANAASTAPFDLATCRGPLSRGSEAQQVALTFNAVASAGHVEEILTILQDKGVPADFFLTGKWVEANPELFQKLTSAGFGAYNFGYSHTDFRDLTPADIQSELEKTDSAFTTSANRSSKPFWRPPYGAINDAVTTEVKKYGFCPILWSVDAYDWQEGITPDGAKTRVLEKVGAGGIAVMQTSNGVVPQFLAALIDELRGKGLTLVPLVQLLAPA